MQKIKVKLLLSYINMQREKSENDDFYLLSEVIYFASL